MAKGYLYDNGDELITREDIPSELPFYGTSAYVGKTLEVQSGSDGNKLYWSDTTPNAVGASIVDGSGTTAGHKFLVLYKSKNSERIKNSQLSQILSTYDYVIALLVSIGDVITIRSSSDVTKVDIKFCYVDSGNLISCNATNLTVPNNSDNVAFDITEYLTTTPLSGGGGGGSLIVTVGEATSITVNGESATGYPLSATYNEIASAVESGSMVFLKTIDNNISELFPMFSYDHNTNVGIPGYDYNVFFTSIGEINVSGDYSYPIVVDYNQDTNHFYSTSSTGTLYRIVL